MILKVKDWLKKKEDEKFANSVVKIIKERMNNLVPKKFYENILSVSEEIEKEVNKKQYER